MKLKHIILVLSLCSIYKTAGQNTSFFDDYRKISFQFGVSKYFGGETTPLPSSLTYKFNNYTSPHFGLYYDVLQTKNFNFKVGLSAILVREIEEFRIDANEIPDVDRDYGFTVEYTTDGTWRFNIPIIAEYLLETSFGKICINGGAIIGYHQEFGNTETEYGVRAPQNEEFTKLSSVYNRSTAPWYLNTQFGVGMYFPFKKWMLRANLYYNIALQDIYTGKFTFSNLAQSTDISGNLSFRGDSFGMEFSIYLKKKKKD